MTDSATLGSLERISEEELLTAERHDVVAWIEVRELSASGEYTPVQITCKNALDKGYFTLRQGLQRRICFTLSHTSGHQFEWTHVKRATIGHVRLLDGKGHILETPAQENIPIKLLTRQNVIYHSDGISQLTAQAAWDSSQHDCKFLNQLTESNSRVILNIRWEVEAERCEKPVLFNMDIALQIKSRDRRSSGSKLSFKRLWYSQERTLTKYSGVFSVHLKPPMTRRTSQLWRLNTATKYVHGEEFLGSWKPRGVSLVQDYNQMQERIHRKNQAAFTRQILSVKDNEEEEMRLDEEQQQALMKRVIDLWQLKMGTEKEIVISQDPPVVETVVPREEPQTTSKLLAQVEFINQPSVNISKKGYILYQQDAAKDLWIKRWFVIRRPYIYIYANETESDEQGIINVASVRIDYNEALEHMINRTNVFAVYTNNNAYTLQAETRQEMIQWIQMIDQKFPLDTIAH
ncbi:kinesin-like protein Klp8 [Rhizopus stolonifer]|uniref:Kinesin-like protein Klp8 n=1 Tax=Rhizopus stolonifer TaxID=4846 RepID=A0A367K194_RHIST|nr:kinesin-like protein Klp8 [Rhizopus stolonifer]